MIEQVALLAQRCFASNPVIVLGSGSSAQYGLPSMDTLKSRLLESIVIDCEEEERVWHTFKAELDAGAHLEMALSNVQLPTSLITKVVRRTWEEVNTADREVALCALRQEMDFEVGVLLKKLFNSSNTTIHVVTTNYDRLAEYACNCQQLIYSCGFTPGYFQVREETDNISIYRGKTKARLVKIWKVHGSLDWFQTAEGRTIGAPLFEFAGDSFSPLIVTPGVSKYQRTHEEPFRSTLQGADSALKQAQGYLCIGFGFRDVHIEPMMIENCRTRNVPVGVLARTLTPEAKSFLRERAGSKYLALEQSATKDGTVAYSPEFPDGMEIPGEDFWSLSGFLKLVA